MLGYVKGSTGGPDAGTVPGVNHMTTIHSRITSFTMPLSATFSRIFSALNQYQAAKFQKACVAKQIALLSALDSHMLSDIGMKGFNRLAPEQQESLLLEAIKHD